MPYVRQHKVTIVVLLLILLGVLLYTVTSLSDYKTRNEVKNPAETSLQTLEEQSPYTTLSGDNIELDNFIGDVLIVHSWASWCPSCKQELQNFSEIVNDDNYQSIKVLAVNRAEQVTTAERYLRTIDVTEDVLLILDPDDRYYKSIGGYSMPETIIYGRNGQIIQHFRGNVPIEQLRVYLNEAGATDEE